MGTSRIEIIKRAASQTGNGALVSIEDNADVARLAEEHYEAVVVEALTQHAWKFARKAEACSLTALTPEKPWEQVWRKPDGLLSLQYAVTAEGVRVDVEERETAQGRCLVTLETLTVLTAVGTFRVDEGSWPGDFAMGVQHRMESVFLAGIAEQRDQADGRDKMAEMKFQRARVRDQRASTSTDASIWDLTVARRRSAAWDHRGYR